MPEITSTLEYLTLRRSIKVAQRKTTTIKYMYSHRAMIESPRVIETNKDSKRIFGLISNFILIHIDIQKTLAQ